MWQFWLLILQSFLFAVIPFIPAVVLRIKFPKTALWIAVVPTVIGFIFLALSMFFDELLFGTIWEFFYNAAFIVPCSLPGLYCVAFFSKDRKIHRIWLALIPSVIFFLYWFARYCISVGFSEAVESLIIGIPGDQSMLITFTCIGFFIWALFCILITFVIAKMVKFIGIGANGEAANTKQDKGL